MIDSFILIGWLATASAPAVVCPLMDDLTVSQSSCSTIAPGTKGYAILREPGAILVRWPTLGRDLWIAQDWVTLRKLPLGSAVPSCMASYYAGEGCPPRHKH
jgi:hypothetical protein